MSVTVGNEPTLKLHVPILLDARQSMPKRMQAVIDANGGHTEYLLLILHTKINCMYDSMPEKLT
jgi:hypothetical protein